MTKFHIYDNGLNSKAVDAEVKHAVSATSNQSITASATRSLLRDIYAKLEALAEAHNELCNHYWAYLAGVDRAAKEAEELDHAEDNT